MTLAESKVLTLPAFDYRGFSVPAIELQKELHGYLNTGKPAHELAPLSSPTAWKVALYHVGRDLSYGFDGAEKLPETVKQVGVLVYADCQAKKGIWDCHKDVAAILDSKATIPGSLRPGKDYVVALFYQDIQGFKEKSNELEIIPSTDSRKQDPVKIWLQPGYNRIIVPTRDGLYSPLGTPIESLPEGQDEKAEKRYSDAGLDYKKERSLSFIAYDGLHVADSGSSEHGGTLVFHLFNGPRYGSCSSSSFLASRSLSGARRDSDLRTYEDGLRDGIKQAEDKLNRFLYGE